ncbi:MAG: hypothetical protein OXG04_20165 [Acidobacteria bacterium]|nr:hypothetical protein [Acidobacteriota bacterium]
MTFVVDTNVAMAANGRETHADARCQLACVERLKSLAAGEVVAIDDRGLILDEFDRSDRKFLAVAVVGEAVVLNATDSDWHEHAALMDSLEVEVTQLCPRYASKKVRRGR